MDQAVATALKTGLDQGSAALLRLTAEQVGAMCDAGVFRGMEKRVELREGLLYRMNVQAVPHLMAKTIMLFALHDALRSIGSSFRVDSEGSVLLDEHNLPEPDVIVWDPLRTRGFVPGERVRLLVEICNTTHADDLGYKPGLYASGGVPEYWIVDLPGHMIHQRWAPAQGAYGQERTVAFGDVVTAATLPGVSLDTTPLLDLDTAG